MSTFSPKYQVGDRLKTTNDTNWWHPDYTSLECTVYEVTSYEQYLVRFDNLLTGRGTEDKFEFIKDGLDRILEKI